MKVLAAACLLAASLVPVAAQEIYKPGNGVSLPVVIKSVNPDYTQEAKQRQIEGDVVLNVVVNAEGSVADVMVAKSLDDQWGLDKQAVNAAKEWKFRPGEKDGKPVAVRVAISLRFTLK